MRAHGHLTLLAACALLASACKGPGTEAANVGESCAESDLIAQCPPGSNPILGATAESMCEASASIDVTTESGSVSGRCFGSGTCRVVCQFASPCKCGVDSVTHDGVFCTPCDEASACGNGICEGGEDPQTCPEDCNAACQPNEERCQGTDRQSCDGTGHWMTLACPTDTVCQPQRDGTTLCVRDDVFSGGETGEPVTRQDRVDGRVWFGDGNLPADGTGSWVPTPPLAKPIADDGYTLEDLFIMEWDNRTLVPAKDFSASGIFFTHPPESETTGGWEGAIAPLDVDEGERLVLWGPKRAIARTLRGDPPPEGESAVFTEYPDDMRGDEADLKRGLTVFSAFSGDRRHVLFARNYWQWSGNPGFTRNADVLLFDATAGASPVLGHTGIFGLTNAGVALSPDARTAAVPVAYGSGVAANAVLVWRDGASARPLVPSRIGETPPVPNRVALSPNGRLLALQSYGAAHPADQPGCASGVDLFNLDDGKRLYTLCQTEGEVWSIVGLFFAPLGGRLALVIGAGPFGTPNASEPGVETWDLTTGKEQARITVPGLLDARYTPDGSAVATLAGSPNDPRISELVLWDQDTGTIRSSVLRWSGADPSSWPDLSAFPDPTVDPSRFSLERVAVSRFVFSARGTRVLVIGTRGQGNDTREFVATFRLNSTLPAGGTP